MDFEDLKRKIIELVSDYYDSELKALEYGSDEYNKLIEEKDYIISEIEAIFTYKKLKKYVDELEFEISSYLYDELEAGCRYEENEYEL